MLEQTFEWASLLWDLDLYSTLPTNEGKGWACGFCPGSGQGHFQQCLCQYLCGVIDHLHQTHLVPSLTLQVRGSYLRSTHAVSLGMVPEDCNSALYLGRAGTHSKVEKHGLRCTPPHTYPGPWKILGPLQGQIGNLRYILVGVF